MLTMNTPRISSVALRTSACSVSFHVASPFAMRLRRARGIDMPTMNKKAGNTTSTKVIPSALPGWMCFIHAGADLTLATSLTNSMRNMTTPRRTSTDTTRSASGAAPIFTSGSRCLRAWVICSARLTPRRRQARAHREPALGRVVDELQIAAVELLEPAPPLDRLERFLLGGELVAAQADAVGLPGHARGPEAAARSPVVDRVVVRGFVDGHTCHGF